MPSVLATDGAFTVSGSTQDFPRLIHGIVPSRPSKPSSYGGFVFGAHQERRSRSGRNKQMSDHPTRDEMNAELGRVSAETDAKFARLEGKIDLVLSKMGDIGTRISDLREDNNGRLSDLKEDNRAIKTNALVIGLTLAGLIIAVGVGVPAIFSNGVQFRDTVRTEVQSLFVRPEVVRPEAANPPVVPKRTQPPANTESKKQQ
jgi:hypothetical protein